MSVSVWLRTSVPVAVEAKSLAIAASCADLALQLPLGMAGHNIIDTLMPDGFAGKRVMSAAIDYFQGFRLGRASQTTRATKTTASNGRDRDDDGQTVLKMNLVLDDEVILGKEEHHALSPNDNTDGALNWLRVDWAKAVETMRTNSWNMRSLESDRITVEPQRFSSWRMDAARYSRCVRFQLCFPYAGTQARVVFQPRTAPRAHG